MRFNVKASLLVSLALGLITPLLAPATASAQTLTVTFETQPVGGGTYAPFNVVAVWIEDAQGQFVKTIGRYSGVRTQHLVAWNQASGGDTDAVSGATRLDHNTALTFEWKLKVDGQTVPEGDYTIRVEVADDNSTTPDQNTQASFTFSHNGEASNEDVTAPGLSNVNVNFDPTPNDDGGGGNGDGGGDGDGGGNGNGNGAGENGGVAVGTCNAGGSGGGSLAGLLCLALLIGLRRRKVAPAGRA